MPGQLTISAPPAVKVLVPFDVAVHIINALPGDTVTIRLWETAGVHPLYNNTAMAAINHLGQGTANFLGVTLEGPCRAHIVADDTVSAVPLDQIDTYIEVTP